MNITAANGDDLASATQTVLSAMQDLDIVAEASSNLSEDQPFIQIKVDRDKAARPRPQRDRGRRHHHAGDEPELGRRDHPG